MNKLAIGATVLIASAIMSLAGLGLGISLRPAEAAGNDSSHQAIRYLNWGKWQTRVGFSQAASVRNPGRLLFLSGVGSEEEQEGQIQHPGDFAAQCNDAWNSIRKILQREGGSVRDIVRVVTYVTDMRHLAENNACKKAVFGNGPYPPHTFLNVSQLALPGMLIEVEVTAALAK